MARTAISVVSLPSVSAGGYDLTGSGDFTTLGTGDGNGVEFTYDAKDLVILKNSTGGDATFTIVLSTPTSISDVGGTVTSPTLVVSNGDTQLLRLTDIFKQSDGKAYIDCDVAADAMVLNL